MSGKFKLKFLHMTYLIVSLINVFIIGLIVGTVSADSECRDVSRNTIPITIIDDNPEEHIRLTEYGRSHYE